MDREEFNALRRSFGLTLAEMAEFLEVSAVTARRWSSGSAPIPGATAKLLRLMVRMKLTPDKVREWLA